MEMDGTTMMCCTAPLTETIKHPTDSTVTGAAISKLRWTLQAVAATESKRGFTLKLKLSSALSWDGLIVGRVGADHRAIATTPAQLHPALRWPSLSACLLHSIPFGSSTPTVTRPVVCSFGSKSPALNERKSTVLQRATAQCPTEMLTRGSSEQHDSRGHRILQQIAAEDIWYLHF
ncbi:unnamed protein product [Phytophthora lilii]|uniref:Unnamed protein product n=1 Tax=Phytophthora lilii TaxID=2077276 RepID=A0A9W7D7M0_9STRA|nr:unnamed protein product [Phytophthora lilii]